MKESNDIQEKIRSLLREGIESIHSDITVKPDGDDSWMDELKQKAENDVVNAIQEVEERDTSEFWGEKSTRIIYDLSDQSLKEISALSYVVDFTAYYDFQQSEENDVEILKEDFKQDIPSISIRVQNEAEWDFQVRPISLEEAQGRTYITFVVI